MLNEKMTRMCFLRAEISLSRNLRIGERFVALLFAMLLSACTDYVADIDERLETARDLEDEESIMESSSSSYSSSSVAGMSHSVMPSSSQE